MIEWPELNAKVKAELLDNKNTELCDVLWEKMPYGGLQEHCLVTGELMYVWVPIVTTVDTPYTERYSEMKPGRITYSIMTGQKYCIVYGPCTETLAAPVVGQVLENDIKTLKEVGKTVAVNSLWKKEKITAWFRRVE
ncbi:MAG: hypothetical protein QW566_11215 [Candidatus Jordarchaeales archaeon]